MISGVGERKASLLFSPVQPHAVSAGLVRRAQEVRRTAYSLSSRMLCRRQHLRGKHSALTAHSSHTVSLCWTGAAAQCRQTCMPAQQVGHVPQLALGGCCLLLQLLDGSQGQASRMRGLHKHVRAEVRLVQLVVGPAAAPACSARSARPPRKDGCPGACLYNTGGCALQGCPASAAVDEHSYTRHVAVCIVDRLMRVQAQLQGRTAEWSVDWTRVPDWRQHSGGRWETLPAPAVELLAAARASAGHPGMQASAVTDPESDLG